MSINIHRNVYTAVAHLTLDVFRMFSLGNEETGVSVPQVMDPNPRQSGSPEGREESSIKEIGGIFWGPIMVEDPGEDSVKRAAKVVGRKDVSILAAAKESGLDFLITLDKKHFLSPRAKKGAGLPVVTPAEFLQYFENLTLEE
jgi:hypothetical protein